MDRNPDRTGQKHIERQATLTMADIERVYNELMQRAAPSQKCLGCGTPLYVIPVCENCRSGLDKEKDKD